MTDLWTVTAYSASTGQPVLFARHLEHEEARRLAEEWFGRKTVDRVSVLREAS